MRCARCSVFCATRSGRYITGQVLGVDGGAMLIGSAAHHGAPANPHQPRCTTCRSDRPAACWNVSKEQATRSGSITRVMKTRLER